MAKKTRKPKGFKEFESLLGKVAQVPKKEVDREIAKDKKRKAKARSHQQ